MRVRNVLRYNTSWRV